MKVKDIIIINEVADDLNEGMKFYAREEIRIGNYFWDSIIADLESLFIYAGIHSKKYGLYRMAAKRFPYAIYYELIDDVAYVIAILPMRRDPSLIMNILEGRN